MSQPYAPLPKPYAQIGRFPDETTDVVTMEQLRAYADATCALRSRQNAADAARYRWLRDGGMPAEGDWPVCSGFLTDNTLWGNELDEAVNNAMKGQPT